MNENIVITRTNIVIPLKSMRMSYVETKAILDKSFSIKYYPKVGYPKIAPQYKLSAEHILLPKAALDLAIRKKIIDPARVMTYLPVSPLEELIGEYVEEERYYPITPKLFANQVIVCDYLMNTVYSKPNSGCVLIAPTGEGKTHIIMGLFSRIGGKLLIVVPNEIILNQTIDVATSAFNNSTTVTAYYGKVKNANGHIVVGIINTLIMQPVEFFDQFTFVAFDEAPDYCSKEYSQIFWKGQGPNTIAVTATPNDRIDGFDKLLTQHVGPHVYVQDIPGFVAENDKFQFKFNILPYNGPREFTQVQVNKKLDVTSASAMVSQFCKDPYRLCLLVTRIMDLYAQSRHIYVFCERRVYCLIIDRVLRELLKPAVYEVGGKKAQSSADPHAAASDGVEERESKEDEEFFILMGGVKKEDLEDAYASTKSSSVVLTTYSYLRRGVSLPRMDTIILATPRRNGLTQIIGRISRRNGNPDIERIVEDIVDNATALRSQVYDRIKAYKLRNHTIVRDEPHVYTEFKTEKRAHLLSACESAIEHFIPVLNDDISRALCNED